MKRFLWMLFMPLVAFGQEKSENIAYIRDYSIEATCPDEYGNSEVGLKACAWDKFHLAEEKLTNLVSNIRVFYFEDATEFIPVNKIVEYKMLFNQAQLAWKKYREADCNELIMFDNYGGNGVSLFMAECNLKHTIARIDELTERYPFKPRG